MNFKIFFLIFLLLLGCDLRPRILSVPDNVGDFIKNRYPALLADPKTEAEIYNSAVLDYGIYNEVNLYGEEEIIYADISDYEMPEQVVKNDLKQDKASLIIAEKKEDNFYIVKKGDTLYSISKQNNMSLDELLKINNLDKNSALKINQKLLINQRIKTNIKDKQKVMPDTKIIAEKKADDFYTVKKGDTLYSISKQNNMSLDELLKLNKLDKNSSLKINQKLLVNQRIETSVDDVNSTDYDNYIVKKNDTIFSISKTYNISVKDLMKINNLDNNVFIKEGQTIKVPSYLVVNKRPSLNIIKNNDNDKTSNNITIIKESLDEYIVKRNDTFYSLSRNYNIAINDLAKINKLTAPFKLKEGQIIKVPKKEQSNRITKKEKNIIKKKKKTKTYVAKLQKRSSNKFSWPVKPRGKIISSFGRKNNNLYNDGINISGQLGDSILASENGIIAYAGSEVKGMGNLIIIQHEGGWMTVYAHLDTINVERGEEIKVNNKIGTMGQTGKVTSPQLHFEIRKGVNPYNPVSYLK